MIATKAQPVKVYALVFAALLVGLLLNVFLAHLVLGRFQALAALVIASAQASLIALCFMHVRHASRLPWLFAAAGFFWLAILGTLTLSDYLSRGWRF